VRILPVLCGSFYESIAKGGLPEDDEEVRRFFEALGEMAAREGKRLAFVLGIDMAHMGRRYGDSFAANANAGEMVGIEERDRARIQRVEAGDATGFWELVREGNDDDLKWCGSSPVYTFLKTVPNARGELLRYEQWNIDRESVVSFAGMVFRG
jgi:AmmeMemoRadiSam system protein B